MIYSAGLTKSDCVCIQILYNNNICTFLPITYTYYLDLGVVPRVTLSPEPVEPVQSGIFNIYLFFSLLRWTLIRYCFP